MTGDEEKWVSFIVAENNMLRDSREIQQQQHNDFLEYQYKVLDAIERQTQATEEMSKALWSICNKFVHGAE